MSYKFNRNCWVDCEGYFLLAIEEKIELADQMFANLKSSLSGDSQISILVNRLHNDLECSCQAMFEVDIFNSCAHCDQTAPEGSCCSRGIENKYDLSLLIANRFMGITLPATHARPESCYFLGSGGCQLRVRHMLCIDYLCPELEKRLGHERLVNLQLATAGEVETTFLLCEQIKKMTYSWGRVNQSSA
jgi:hypothetical protein